LDPQSFTDTLRPSQKPRDWSNSPFSRELLKVGYNPSNYRPRRSIGGKEVGPNAWSRHLVSQRGGDPNGGLCDKGDNTTSGQKSSEGPTLRCPFKGGPFESPLRGCFHPQTDSNLRAKEGASLHKGPYLGDVISALSLALGF